MMINNETRDVKNPEPSLRSSAEHPPNDCRSFAKLAPKGLRAYDRFDSDFFLGLVPGDRDSEGLPESLRFWKNWIERSDANTRETSRVGLIFGPCGSGKTSLIKAGLLPRLAEGVVPIHIEADSGETEARLLEGLRKACPGLPTEVGLVGSLERLRNGIGIMAGKKVLLIIDQFEQWLFAHRQLPGVEFTTALSQCDGRHVQAIIVVSDDFWMALNRFSRSLGVAFVDRENAAPVDFFDPIHAGKVLVALGVAGGHLPQEPEKFTLEQTSFLDQSIRRLARDGRIAPVDLALFVELVKARQWTLATLEALGDLAHVGAEFLEETFNARTTRPELRRHLKGEVAILKALLPVGGTDLKGPMRSATELRTLAQYETRPQEFERLIAILDTELDLITAIPQLERGDDNCIISTSTNQKSYQLTHDILVPSLWRWLNRRHKESLGGRSELRLAVRSTSWNAKPENRRLPRSWEWAAIRLLTRSRNWSGPERKMMRVADRRIAVRALVAFVLLFLAGWSIFKAVRFFTPG